MKQIHSVDDSALIQYKMIRYWVDAGRLHPLPYGMVKDELPCKNKRKIMTR